jgi:hypothetical protein
MNVNVRRYVSAMFAGLVLTAGAAVVATDMVVDDESTIVDARDTTWE